MTSKHRFYSAFFTLIFALLFVYAHWIEPNWIEVTHYSIKADVSRSFKIAHISDLHIRALGKREAKVLFLLAEEKPDVVLITGDSIAENADYASLSTFLKKLHAPLGVWAVKGNWEHWKPNEKEAEIYRASGIRLLDNAAAELFKGVWVIGVDDELAGHPDLERALAKVPPDVFKIGLFHSPAFFDQSGQKFQMALAGHTHGGQVRVPFLPPFWLPEGSGRFVSGWYGEDSAKMYVSRGLGNSILDLRFACRPELPIITVGRMEVGSRR